MNNQTSEYRASQQSKAAELKKTMIGKKYRHFKGNIYQVDTIAIHSETSELRVIYHSIDNPDLIWDRDLEMFLSPVDKVKYPNVEQELRFEPIDEEIIPTITIPVVTSNKVDATYAVKDEYGNYFVGYTQWSDQIRKAKLYRSKFYAEELCNSSRFKHKKLSIVRVCTAEIAD